MNVKMMVLFAAATAAFTLQAGLWRGLTDENHYSGPKLSEADLDGKVVMIDEWGVMCKPCKALLPQMQKYYSAFKTKNFVLIGSHRQGRQPEAVAELVKAYSLTYPIYDNVGLAVGEPDNGGAIPFIYVVNHRGKIVYSGRSDREAIEAAQNAFMAIGQPPSFTGSIIFGKKHPYRSFEKQLVLGKNIESVEKKLKNEIKKATSKTAGVKVKENAHLAEELLEAISEGKREIVEDIARMKTSNPPEALKLMEGFIKSFPAEGKQYKEELASVKAAAKDYVAEKKARESAAKKAGK